VGQLGAPVKVVGVLEVSTIAHSGRWPWTRDDRVGGEFFSR